MLKGPKKGLPHCVYVIRGYYRGGKSNQRLEGFQSNHTHTKLFSRALKGTWHYGNYMMHDVDRQVICVLSSLQLYFWQNIMR